MTTDIGRKSKNGETASVTNTQSGEIAGTTEVVNDVIAAIAGYVAKEVEGVVRIGGDSVMRKLTDTVSSDKRQKGAGISVEAGLKEAIFDLDLTVQFGRPIPTIVREVRERIRDVVSNQVGLRAKEINIKVSNIEFETEKRDEGRTVE